MKSPTLSDALKAAADARNPRPVPVLPLFIGAGCIVVFASIISAAVTAMATGGW